MTLLARRDLETRQRVEHILDAATRIFARKGPHMGTCKEIAAAAGVSPGTIYNYFKSKRSLLLAIIRRFATTLDLHRVVAQSPDTDARELIRHLFRHQANWSAQHRDLLRAGWSEILVDARLQRLFLKQFRADTAEPLHHFIETQIAAGRIRAVPPDVATRAVIAIFWGLMLCEITDRPIATCDHEQLTDELADLLFDGLAVT